MKKGAHLSSEEADLVREGELCELFLDVEPLKLLAGRHGCSLEIVVEEKEQKQAILALCTSQSGADSVGGVEALSAPRKGPTTDETTRRAQGATANGHFCTARRSRHFNFS